MPTPPTRANQRRQPLIWANLIHLSYNMWGDRRPHDSYVKNMPTGEDCNYQPYLRFDDALWEELVARMVDAGFTMVVLDLGDAVRYESHPEIAVEQAWSTARLVAELDHLRDLGLEPIPKLNFSTSHDAWLGEYARCVSTPRYYQVCRDLIDEVSRLFDTPRFFHIGMDEEEVGQQRLSDFICCRQYELWWHDLFFYLDAVAQAGSRPWMWSDYAWGKGQAPAPRRAARRNHAEYAYAREHAEIFFERMPKSVLQSNWYYELDFTESRPEVRLFTALARHGYQQIPTGSNFATSNNFEALVDYVETTCGPRGVLGYLQTPWYPTLPAFRTHHLEAIDSAGRAISKQATRRHAWTDFE